MTSKYDGFEHNKSVVGSEGNELMPADSFELLSAFIDGELSAQERNQVQYLLDRDPKIKNLYTRLLSLQGQMQSLEAPSSNKSVDQITAGVFQSIEQRRRQRLLVWGSSAIAASVLAGITGLIPGFSPGLRIAKTQDSGNIKVAQPVMLAVAVNRPAIDIPKTVNGYGTKSNNSELE